MPVVSLVRALGGSGLKGLQGLGLAALLVVLVAALDEQNQARIAGRSGRPEDVALDFVGFLLFCGLTALWARSHGARLRSAADDALCGPDL
ncbi:MAG: VanZ family protein [Firmicutes bacterium]|nr:VanZ family protein [Bacillota bacterium]